MTVKMPYTGSTPTSAEYATPCGGGARGDGQGGTHRPPTTTACAKSNGHQHKSAGNGGTCGMLMMASVTPATTSARSCSRKPYDQTQTQEAGTRFCGRAGGHLTTAAGKGEGTLRRTYQCPGGLQLCRGCCAGGCAAVRGPLCAVTCSEPSSRSASKVQSDRGCSSGSSLSERRMHIINAHHQCISSVHIISAHHQCTSSVHMHAWWWRLAKTTGHRGLSDHRSRSRRTWPSLEWSLSRPGRRRRCPTGGRAPGKAESSWLSQWVGTTAAEQGVAASWGETTRWQRELIEC